MTQSDGTAGGKGNQDDRGGLLLPRRLGMTSSSGMCFEFCGENLRQNLRAQWAPVQPRLPLQGLTNALVPPVGPV
ncbi:unnamed protein product [Arctogadus glacialis]